MCMSKKDVTEAHSKSDTSEVVKGIFKPLCYTKDSQPCLCSACVGAMATILTPVSELLVNLFFLVMFPCCRLINSP